MQRDFPEYAWSLCTLDRRLRYFDIYKTEQNVSVEKVQGVVLEKISRLERLSGYRAMHTKIRQYHQLNIPRTLVHGTMVDVDPNGLRNQKKAKEKKKVLHLKGPIGYFLLMVMISSWTCRTLYLRNFSVRLFRHSQQKTSLD